MVRCHFATEWLAFASTASTAPRTMTHDAAATRPSRFSLLMCTPAPTGGQGMDLVKRLEEYRDRERALAWEGTFADYFEIAIKRPSVTQLSHARVYDMIMAAGTETTRQGDLRYNFFTEEIFGIEKPLQQIVEYFHSAAQRLEVRKRILLLMGPVGGGKSSIVALLK